MFEGEHGCGLGGCDVDVEVGLRGREADCDEEGRSR